LKNRALQRESDRHIFSVILDIFQTFIFSHDVCIIISRPIKSGFRFFQFVWIFWRRLSSDFADLSPELDDVLNEYSRFLRIFMHVCWNAWMLSRYRFRLEDAC
jgi:hypothetical protein